MGGGRSARDGGGDAACTQVVVLQHEATTAKDAVSLKDMEVASLKQRVAAQLAEAAALQAENQQLRQELEDVG